MIQFGIHTTTGRNFHVKAENRDAAVKAAQPHLRPGEAVKFAGRSAR